MSVALLESPLVSLQRSHGSEKPGPLPIPKDGTGRFSLAVAYRGVKCHFY